VGGKLPSPGGVPVCIQYSPDGTLIAAGCDDGTVYLFDPRLETEIVKLKVAGEAHALSFSIDGRLLAVAGSEAVHVFEVGSWKLIRKFGEHSGGINAIAFSPNGKVLAAGCGTIEGNDRITEKGVVQIWDVSTGELRNDLK
jgi:WD40 repeat protein